MSELPDFEIIIPVYNGGEVFKSCLNAIAGQSVTARRIIVVDSASTDGSAEVAQRAGCLVQAIPKETFDHGGTRSLALGMVESPISVFITQDALLEGPDSLANLLRSFERPGLAAVYGRQLPHDDADPLAVFARSKTYSDQSYYCRKDDSVPVGFAKCFMSNSFAAYDTHALREIGGFPEKLILGEDSFATAKLLIAGYEVGYNANAMVKHSHNYTPRQEFQRYFDTGVFHDAQYWIIDAFGSPLSRGKDFAISQIKWLASNGHAGLIHKSILSSLAKLIGYKLGRKHQKIGSIMSKRLAMHKSYFSSTPVKMASDEGSQR